ncbi:MAG TPA: zinc ABC transporter substrate-binding protein [Nitrososphaerales archaeon]|nr:zinc ABC transporter substrate-binding protein [Nitrososphaerales archaeon]
MSGSVGRAGNKYLVPAAIVVILLVVGVAAGVYLTRGSTSSSSTSSSGSSSDRVIDVVAAENFWGSLVSQLGGAHANVTSIVSDPNTDPHEYTTNPAAARAIAGAQLVVVNGAGYDTWALNLIASASTPNQKVLNVQQLIGASLDTNPHFWYSPYYVNDSVHSMYDDLVAIDPTDTAYFHQQYAILNSSLWTSYMKQESLVRQQFGGAPVASTEDIFLYMANATGLKVVSPPGFMTAVSQGSDPSAQDVANMENLMMGGNSTVHVLVYNQQTVTPLTQNIKTLATQNQIPVVAVTETIQPPTYTFQFWMGSEVISLQNALNSQALGR